MGNFLRRYKFLSILMVLGIITSILAATLLLINPLKAYSTGMTGHSGNPAINGGINCSEGGCHGTGVFPTVELNGPAQVISGEVVQIAFSVTSGALEVQDHAGLNVSATGGILSNANAETQVVDDEITHTIPKMNDGTGTAEFTFNWTAPDSLTLPMTYTLYAAGNSVNMNGNPSGDRASTDALEIVVTPPTTPELTLTEVISSSAGLNRPVGITHAGDERLFIVEKPGRIRIFDGSSLLATPFLDIESLVDDTNNEQGLLGLAFHPDYANNGYFYVNYTYDPAGSGLDRTRIARYQVNALNPNLANPASAIVLLEFEQDAGNHNGGDIHFSPNDGYLYISVGDGGLQGDPNNRAQTNTQLLGKMLRIDVDTAGATGCDISGNNNYGIPPSNPYADGAGGDCDEIWQNGVRNPWRFSFDKDTADMWIADVGYSNWEEIDFQAAASSGGENWGWRCYEGNHAQNTSGCGLMGDYDFPVHEYNHLSGECSITGGFVYRGEDILALNGHYLFADYCSRRFWSLSGSGNDLTAFGLPTIIGAGLGSPTTFGEDVNGNVYVAEDGFNASIYKVTAVALPCFDESPTTVLPIIMLSDSDVGLSWNDNAANKGGYAIHRTTTPNFAPNAKTILATLPAGSEVYTDTNAIGDVTKNYNYVVQSRNCNASNVANSSEVGEFDFAVVQGN